MKIAKLEDGEVGEMETCQHCGGKKPSAVSTSEKGEAHASEEEILRVHAEFGRLNKEGVQKAMGPNWPKHWDQFKPGEAIFEGEPSEITALRRIAEEVELADAGGYAPPDERLLMFASEGGGTFLGLLWGDLRKAAKLLTER